MILICTYKCGFIPNLHNVSTIISAFKLEQFKSIVVFTAWTKRVYFINRKHLKVPFSSGPYWSDNIIVIHVLNGSTEVPNNVTIFEVTNSCDQGFP